MWWVESDFKAPNLPLSLRFKGSGCHCNRFYPGTPVSSTYKTDHHDITEILLKVVLNIITSSSSYIKITRYLRGLGPRCMIFFGTLCWKAVPGLPSHPPPSRLEEDGRVFSKLE
jgi:hypothetical protein